MTKIYIAFVLILVSYAAGHSQRTKVSNRACSFIIKCGEPSIYFTVVQDNVSKDSAPKEKKERSVWLRIHNNTRWRILILAAGGDTEQETSLFYEFLDDKGGVTGGSYCHVCSRIWLRSAKNILFKVPLRYFKNTSTMRLSFNYEWEDEPFSATEKEPIHYVQFDVPSELKEP
jgi:hypothetical protein